jgi:hypothetical protein
MIEQARHKLSEPTAHQRVQRDLERNLVRCILRPRELDNAVLPHGPCVELVGGQE